MSRQDSGRRAAVAAVARYAPAATAGHTIVLVEGASDQAALTALADRDGRRLAAEDVFVVPMGGASSIGHFLDALGPNGLGMRLAGLCDAAEEPDFRRGLERAGLSVPPGREALERAGFFVCVEDLEDELIRSLGADRTMELVAEQGEMGPFRTFAQQPFHRGRSREQQLHRFMGTRSGRKIHYGRMLVEALDDARIPDPLARLLAYV
ncbi:hypothetical protein CIK06_08910 [Plantactinospora sp. KBS50]|nr:hypothetical protein CIK06_08910 [Plantactinospora sp. KBS50]